MDDKIKILLDKINIDETSYQYFNDAKITKIKVNSKTNSWNIFIDKDELLPVEILEELESKKMLLDELASKIEIIFNIKNPNIDTYLSYYKYLLKTLNGDCASLAKLKFSNPSQRYILSRNRRILILRKRSKG